MKYFKIILIIVVFFILIVISGKLVSLKYINLYPEGSFISDYYKESTNHDVIFLGDCEAYTSFSPVTIYNETSITSFVRGNSRQLIGQSYYVLSETLKYEIPKVVVLSVGSMQYDFQIKEEYNRLLLDKMRWSKDKYNLINYSKMDNENILSYIFPLIRYHERITKLNMDDINYLLNDKVVSHNGFIINTAVKPLTVLPTRKVLDNYNFSDENILYLNKIVSLCKENNITLILEKSPTMYPYWYQEYDEFFIKFAEDNNIDYYNFLNLKDEIGIDYSKDTYDAGVHLNLSGALKLSKYFANILKNKYGLKGHLEENVKMDYNMKYKRFMEEVNEKNNS